MLMLHKGCRRVARADLTDIPVPEASGRHLPVPHHVLADTVVVSSKDVEKPVAVRYLYTMTTNHGTLYNGGNLPASPFRTDDW